MIQNLPLALSPPPPCAVKNKEIGYGHAIKDEEANTPPRGKTERGALLRDVRDVDKLHYLHVGETFV